MSQDLKAYSLQPDDTQREEVTARFDTVFRQKTGYVSLDLALRRLHRNRDELLLVLKRPEVPLHTNGSERDIREPALPVLIRQRANSLAE